jgi:glycosyltransferase involved in cell wall biosynthesis
MRPTVTIGMTAYNGAKFISEAIRSLLNQTFTDFELLIFDDASVDNTAALCMEFAALDARVQYHRNSTNLGMIQNFNCPLENARGEYFMWASHDDVWEPTFLEKMVNLLNADSTAVIAFCQFDNIDKCGNQTKTYLNLDRLCRDNVFERMRIFIREEEYHGKPNLLHGLARIEAILRGGKIGAWGKGLWFDTLYGFRMISLGNVLVESALLFHKRLSPNSNFQWHVEDDASIKEKINSLRADLWDWTKYFYGYLRIIKATEEISYGQRKRLEVEVIKRCAVAYWRSDSSAALIRTIRSFFCGFIFGSRNPLL